MKLIFILLIVVATSIKTLKSLPGGFYEGAAGDPEIKDIVWKLEPDIS